MSACHNTYVNCYERFANVSDKDTCEASLKDFQKQLGRLACNWPHEIKIGQCGGQDYVRYEAVVKVGGRPTWRNNNPGAITCLSDRASYGAYETCKSFAVFPDFSTGTRALHQWLVTNKTRSIINFTRTHAPADNGAKLNKGNDPVVYANAILDKLRKDHPGKVYSRDTLLGSLDESELDSVVKAVTQREGSTNPINQGKTYPTDKLEAIPENIRNCLSLHK